jgi:hypothetical protein
MVVTIAILLCVSLTWANEPSQPETQGVPQTGELYGRVSDKATHQPLPAVSVLVEGSRLGASTNIEGKFRIERVPVGSHNLRFMMIGYETLVKSNVVANPGRETRVDAELREVALEMETIQVRASFFEKARDAVVTTRTMDFEEIRQDPGSSEDIQRVMQALPAVVSGSDQMNEIIVRGGIPGENLFLLDTIEIPNPNHFGQQGSGGGPISAINTHFVREVNFMAGAFPAKYGDKVSSVMDIALREGSRKRMEGSFDLGMAGAGGLFEGPLSGGRGSYLLSARKSYLDLLISSWGLTAVPRYYNLQGKVVYDLNVNNKLLVNAIYGNDRITIEHEEEEDATGYVEKEENVRTQSHQYAAGVTLRSLWSKGFSDLTISRALNYWDTFVYDAAGDPYYTNQSTEAENTAKFDGVVQFSKAHEISRIPRSSTGWSSSPKRTRSVRGCPTNRCTRITICGRMRTRSSCGTLWTQPCSIWTRPLKTLFPIRSGRIKRTCIPTRWPPTRNISGVREAGSPSTSVCGTTGSLTPATRTWGHGWACLTH